MTGRGQHQPGPKTLPERLAEAHPDIDPLLLQDVEGAWKLGTSHAVRAAGNNRFPHWDMQTFLLAFTAVCTGVGTLVGAVFFVGGQWSSMRNDVVAVKTGYEAMAKDHGQMHKDIEDGKRSTQSLEEQVDRMNGIRRQRQTPVLSMPGSGTTVQ
jgi:hypothetical protein